MSITIRLCLYHGYNNNTFIIIIVYFQAFSNLSNSVIESTGTIGTPFVNWPYRIEMLSWLGNCIVRVVVRCRLLGVWHGFTKRESECDSE